MSNVIDIEQLTTIDGYLKVGYTKETCNTKRGIRLFDKVDTDGDGILSSKEIIERRKKEAKIKTIEDTVGVIGGIALIAFGILGKSHTLDLEKLCTGIGCTMGAAFHQVITNDEDEKTKAFEKELCKLNTEC